MFRMAIIGLIEFMVSPQRCPDTPPCDGDDVLSSLEVVVQVLPARVVGGGDSVRALHHVQPGQVGWHTGVLTFKKVKQGALIDCHLTWYNLTLHPRCIGK